MVQSVEAFAAIDLTGEIHTSVNALMVLALDEIRAHIVDQPVKSDIGRPTILTVVLRQHLLVKDRIAYRPVICHHTAAALPAVALALAARHDHALDLIDAHRRDSHDDGQRCCPNNGRQLPASVWPSCAASRAASLCAARDGPA